jgi:serine/threonine-protein kinase
MNNDPAVGESCDTFERDPLQAGLRAAFALNREERESALATLENANGVSSNILLREEPDEQAGLVVAATSEATRSRKACGRYVIDGEIARGGIGVILRGRDPDLGRDLAMKRLRAEHATNPLMIQRLIEEAQIGGQLQHPGILPVFELGVDAELRPFFTMKLVRGRTLASLLDERPSNDFERRRFLGVFELVCQTVAYAHARGVIHRDLKPSNILVGSFGEVQVVDWGLAKVMARKTDETQTGSEVASAPSNTSVLPTASAISSAEPPVSTNRTGSDDALSAAGSVIGTPAYMSPEQARGAVDLQDERCDVFALGSILCEILTGSPVYAGTRAEMLRAAAEADVTQAVARLDRCLADAELVDLACRCLAPELLQRPRDAVLVAREVTAYLERVEERSRAAELAVAEAKVLLRSERRLRRLSVIAGILACVTAIASGAMFVSEHQRAGAERRSVLLARSQLLAERERAEALERGLQVFVTLQGKGEYLLARAADSEPEKAKQWADLMGYVRQGIERSLPGITDQNARDRARILIGDLRRKESELRQKAIDSPPN